MKKNKVRNIFALHAWNRKAGKHKNKKWIFKNRRRKVDDYEP